MVTLLYNFYLAAGMCVSLCVTNLLANLQSIKQHSQNTYGIVWGYSSQFSLVQWPSVQLQLANLEDDLTNENYPKNEDDLKRDDDLKRSVNSKIKMTP